MPYELKPQWLEMLYDLDPEQRGFPQCQNFVSYIGCYIITSRRAKRCHCKELCMTSFVLPFENRFTLQFLPAFNPSVHVISRKRLTEFAEKHPEAKASLARKE